MKHLALAVALLFVVSSPNPAAAQDFSRFTVFANLGAGFQSDFLYGEKLGLAGLNFGAGIFLTRDLAVLGRVSQTTVTFDEFESTQTSGVWAGSVQYWLNNWASIEGGAGYGRWADSQKRSEGGFGYMVAFHASVFQRDRHHLRVGVEYARAYTDAGVRNVGVVVGYQYGRRKTR